jgi:[ribosomal protein S5]-alanine N-acetyltransferase
MPLNLDPLFANTPVFITERLTLRPVQGTDVPALSAVNSDPEVTRYLPYPTWTTEADATAWFDRLQKRFASREAAQFAICIRDQGDLVIGNALLFGFSVEHEVAEIGYVIGRAHWGKGYVTEAMQPLMAYAFETLHCHRLQAKLSAENRASARVLEKLGFAYEGTSREDFVKDGVRSDTAFFGVLQREWPITR